MSEAKTIANEKFLIIAGTSKAGTTSVFNYLAKHPQICATDVKETRFFLDADYPLPSAKRHSKDGPGAYLSFFDFTKARQENSWLLEATPDYLYSPNTPELFRKTLPNVRLIFLLREPISRLMSFFQFGKQITEIPQAMSFDEYLALQQKTPGEDSPAALRHPVFHALQHGRYSDYLEPFLKVFERSAVYVAFYEELKSSPELFMTSLCHWLGIDASYFRNYRFQIINKGVRMRSPRINRLYYQGRQRSRRMVRNYPGVRAFLNRVGGRVNALYRKINVAQREEVLISPSTEEFLQKYYLQERVRLEEMLGGSVPWPNARKSDASGVRDHGPEAVNAIESGPERPGLAP